MPDVFEEYPRGADFRWYFRLPLSERDAFADNLLDPQRRKLDAEIQRIARIRAHIEADVRHRNLVRNLHRAGSAWRAPDLLGRVPFSPPGDNQPSGSRSSEGSQPFDPLQEIKAGVMHFEKTETGKWLGVSFQDEEVRYASKFPDQKIAVQNLLGTHEHNPFSCKPDRLKYFHFPANHMDWIEEAVARHYDEVRYDDDARIRTNEVLSREYWRGQLQGSGLGKNPLHARYMRPMCSTIQPAPVTEEAQATTSSTRRDGNHNEHDGQRRHPNLAIFLQYLHWETDSRRDSLTKLVKDISQVPPFREPLRVRPTLLRTSKSWFHNQVQDGYLAGAVSSRFQRKSDLGQYLFNAARLWDTMDCYADERLLRDSAKTDERPLLIRQTLDQSDSLTVEDTAARDRDQVVYRETKANRVDSARIGRVIMVDQLWMWIMDEPALIIEQCTTVFFHPENPMDLRPDLLNIFREATGKMNDFTTTASESFWTTVRRLALGLPPRGMAGQQLKSAGKYLDINPEATLLRETRDIAEELRMMDRIYRQQLSVIRDFREVLTQWRRAVGLPEHAAVGLGPSPSTPVRADIAGRRSEGKRAQRPIYYKDLDPQLVDDIISKVALMQSETIELDHSAAQTTNQLMILLDLKQKQASIVEAKMALKRAEESERQSRAIMTFTVVTIFFLPLGFFATFFGMNNAEITGSLWMTLNDQIKYMFGLSSVVISISLLAAFMPWITIWFPLSAPLIWVWAILQAIWHSIRRRYLRVLRRRQLRARNVEGKSV